MRQALTIAARDLRANFLTAFGLGSTAGFAAAAGVVLVVVLRGNQARLAGWFGTLYVLLGVLAALLTMRSFAEEERLGTLELLLTSPVRPWQVVTGKLLGVAGVLLVDVAATLACPLLVASMGHPDAGPILTGYVGVILVGLAFVAVGLAVSAATSNPLVAAVGSLAVLLALWGAGIVSGGLTGWPRLALEELAPSGHVVGFLRGTLSTKDVVYFVSLLALGLVTNVVVLEERR